MRHFRVVGADGEGVDVGGAGDVEIHRFVKLQALLHILAEGIQFGEHGLRDGEAVGALVAMERHLAAPPVVAGDDAHHIPLEGLVNLAGKFFLERNFRVQCSHDDILFRPFRALGDTMFLSCKGNE